MTLAPLRLLALVVAASLAACGSGPSENTGDNAQAAKKADAGHAHDGAADDDEDGGDDDKAGDDDHDDGGDDDEGDAGGRPHHH